MREFAAILLVAQITAVGVMGQAQTAPRFEAASIRPSQTATGGMSMRFEPGGRLVMTRGPVRALIGVAYPTQTREIVGLPQWVLTEPYDVLAVAEGNPTREEMQAMLRTLLAERFNLVVRYETRERDIYAMVLANDDGRLGPQLQPSPLDCAAVIAARQEGKPMEVPAPSNGGPPCAMAVTDTALIAGGIRLADLGAAPLDRR